MVCANGLTRQGTMTGRACAFAATSLPDASGQPYSNISHGAGNACYDSNVGLLGHYHKPAEMPAAPNRMKQLTNAARLPQDHLLDDVLWCQCCSATFTYRHTHKHIQHQISASGTWCLSPELRKASLVVAHNPGRSSWRCAMGQERL